MLWFKQQQLMDIREQLEPHPLPPVDFAARSLPILESTGPWYRLSLARYPSALYFDRTGNGRFDGPQQSYGILYVGEDIFGPFIESFGRTHGILALTSGDLQERYLAQFVSVQPLRLVDLCGAGLPRIGADNRINNGENYSISRQWVQAIWQHPDPVDGIRYPSRHDPSRILCGLFDRAKENLQENKLGTLLEDPQTLAAILDTYKFGLV